jgi:hypothetical protein
MAASTAAPQAAAPAVAAQKPSDWHINVSGGVVNASRFGYDPDISLTCNAQMHRVGLVITFNKYKGGLLKTVEGANSPFILDIRNGNGDGLQFPMIAYYTDADGGDNWITKENLTSAFLDAFGQQGRLIWQTAKGVEIASWPLQGTAKARSLIRQICNF